MRVIKRYSNRKLYDTEDKRYVTLEEVSSLVRGGADVKVLDNETEEDLTTITLSQILLDKERKHKNPLPKSFFTNVLQSGTKIKEAIVEQADRFFGPGLENALKTLRIPSRSEFELLAKAVASLEEKIAILEKKVTKPKKKQAVDNPSAPR
jgi:polyhydroxyalkanoate synthesis repressor PhaR